MIQPRPERSRRDLASKEVPRMRPCLAEGHNHLFLTTKAVRICPKGRYALEQIDPIYGGNGGGALTMRTRTPFRAESGVAAYAMETT